MPLACNLSRSHPSPDFRSRKSRCACWWLVLRLIVFSALLGISPLATHGADAGAPSATSSDDHFASLQFSQAVEHWLAAHKPDWFDYASPRSLDDPALRDPAAFLDEAPAAWCRAEVIKGELLIAASGSQPLEREVTAWNTAVDDLLPLCQTRQESRALVESVIAENGFTDEVRTQAVWLGAMAAADHLHSAEFEHWAHDPRAEKLDGSDRAAIEATRKMLIACTAEDASPAIEAASREILRKPVGYWEARALRTLFFYCLRAGAFPTAERLTRLYAHMEMAPDCGETRTKFRSERMKHLREARRLAPLFDELRRLTLEHVPAERIQRPAILDEWSNTDNLDDLSDEDAQQTRLWQIKTRTWGVQNFVFWTKFMNGLASTPQEQEFGRSLKTTLLRLTTTDRERLMAVGAVQDSTDTDTLDGRQWLDETLRSYRDPVKWPLTYAVIRVGEIRVALRAGEPIDLAGRVRALQALPKAKQYGEMMTVEHYLQVHDVVNLGKALDATPPDVYLQSEWLTIAIPALELAGRSDAADRAREIARGELGRAFLRSWSEGVGQDAYTAFRLVKELFRGNDEDPIPAHWVEGCLARIRNRSDSFRLRLDAARYRKDWPTQARLAAEAITAFPTDYFFYYDQAEALYMTGHKEDARHPLEIYTRFSKNEPEYPQAMEWLREVNGPSSVP